MYISHSLLIQLLVLLLLTSPYACDGHPTAMDTSSIPGRQSIVFIAGFDEGDNRYYDNARAYFQSQNLPIVDSLYSLEEIISWLNTHADHTAYEAIHIVSHSNPWRGMSMRVRAGGDRITENSLRSALIGNELSQPKQGILDETRLVFHSCGLGENTALLSMLKEAFSGSDSPQVYASPLYNVFGGRFAPHYLAKAYYAYYPTAESPGPWAMAQEFNRAYPDAAIDWRKAMKTREAKSQGEVYSYRFNVPVEWEFTFDDPGEMPELRNPEEIMDWVAESDAIVEVLFAFNIPLEKYRWRAVKSGNTLTIKGKTTILCVMEPAMQSPGSDEYLTADISNPALYIKL